MPATLKFFWCEYCRAEISYRSPATQTVQRQAEHLFEEHGIDIHADYDAPPVREEAVVLAGDPR
jgi:hypothetical protein